MLCTWQHRWGLQIWKGVRPCTKKLHAFILWLRPGNALCTAFLTFIVSWRQLHLACFSVGLCSPRHKPQPAVRKAWTYQSDVLPTFNLQLSGEVFPDGNAGGVLRYQLLRCVSGVCTSSYRGQSIGVHVLQGEDWKLKFLSRVCLCGGLLL